MKKFLATGLLLAASALQASATDDVTVVLDADFTQFTEGTPAKPVDFPSYGTGSFTSYFSGWYSSKIAKAGGALIIKDGGYVQTKSCNVSAHGGVMRISSRVRMTDAYGGILKISAGYSTAGSTTVMLTDSLWHDVSVVIAGGTSSTRIKVEPSLSASGVLLQNLKVEQSAGFIAAPVAYQPTQADGVSFTARWKSVSGATAYLLNVYSYNGTEKVYKLKEQNVGTALSYKVTDLDPAVQYYYTVQATNGTGVSDPSEEIRVVKVISSLATPQGLSGKADSVRLQASWLPVKDAQHYVLNVSGVINCVADKEVKLLSESFSKVTEGTLSNIEFTTKPLSNFTFMPGWEGSELGLAAGHIVISPYGSTGYVATPLLDMEGKDGTVTYSARLACGAFGTMRTGSATVSLLNAAGDTLQSKPIELTEGFADYSVTLTSATANCRIAISYNGSYKLFIDSIEVRQLKKAGQKVKCYLTEISTPEVAVEYEYGADAAVLGERPSYFLLTVSAAAETVVAGEITTIFSEASEPVEAKIETGAVNGTFADDVVVSVADGLITVSADRTTAVSLYDMSGRILLQTTVAGGTTATLRPQLKGICILVAGGRAQRVRL